MAKAKITKVAEKGAKPIAKAKNAEGGAESPKATKQKGGSKSAVKELPPVPTELKEAAVGYKRRISSQFMLVDLSTARDFVRGRQFCVTRKIDGLMACAFYKDGKITLVGSGGRNLSAVPCADVMAASLARAGVGTATISCELYLPVTKGRPRVGDALSALSDAAAIGGLRLAPFDLVELDGALFKSANYKDEHDKLVEIFTDEAVLPVELKLAQSYAEIEEIYKEWVEGEGAEGLVIHSESPIVWKMKPRHPVDVAVVGYTIGDQGVRDMLFAVRDESGAYRVVGSVGSGLTQEARTSLAVRLKKLDCESKFVQADSRGVAFKMVKPEVVVELSIGEFVSEDSSGRPKYNNIAVYDEQAGWISAGRSAGVAAFRIVFERERDDKTVEISCVRESQVTDLCPFAAPKSSVETTLPKSSLLVRKVFKKEAAGKLMVQKYLVWQTNKEKDPRYPAFVYHYTDYSSGRKDPLKRDIRVSSTKEQVVAFMEADMAENVKKGWIEV